MKAGTPIGVDFLRRKIPILRKNWRINGVLVGLRLPPLMLLDIDMLTFIISVIVAALIAWGLETWSRIANPNPNQLDEISQDWKAIKTEFTGVKDGLQRLGWNILWPLTPLVGLICLVAWAVTKNN